MTKTPYPAKELELLESRYSFASDDIYYYNVHRPAVLVKELQHRTEHFDQSLIPQIIESALHEQVEHYDMSKYLGTGHIIAYIKTKSGKNLVLRATHALSEPEKYMEMEKEIIDRYQKVGIPSTVIIAADSSRQSFPVDYQIMLPLTGRDLEVEWDGSQEDYDALSFKLGRLLAKQYQLPGSGWGRWTRNKDGKIVGAKKSHHDYLTAYLDHDLSVIQLFSLTSEQGIGQLRSYFNSSNLIDLFSDISGGYFVHHDVADHNIRYTGREIVALYDWENAVVYDPLSDIGSAPTWKVQYPREAKLREGFLAELGNKPHNFAAKADVYFLRTMLWKVAFALKGQRLAPRHLDLFSDALRRNGLAIKLSSDCLA